MFTDLAEPALSTSDAPCTDVDEPETSEEELSRQISQLSSDSGISSDEIKRYLSIDEVLGRYQKENAGLSKGSEARDFAYAGAIDPPPEIGEGEFPKDRKMADRPILKRVARKIDGLIAKNF